MLHFGDHGRRLFRHIRAFLEDLLGQVTFLLDSRWCVGRMWVVVLVRWGGE